MHPTNRERQTGGETPHDLAAQQEYGLLMEDATVIEPQPGEAGWVTVRRTPGRPLDPHAPLVDGSDSTSFVVAPDQPGVRVEYRHGGKP